MRIEKQLWHDGPILTQQHGQMDWIYVTSVRLCCDRGVVGNARR